MSGNDGFDPNVPLAPKELAVVLSNQRDIQNKHLSPGKLGEVTAPLRRAVVNLTEQVQRMAVTDTASYGRAGALLKTVKSMIQQSTLERKTFTGPILALKESVDAVFKVMADTDLERCKIAIEAAMLRFAQEERLRQAVAEQAALVAAQLAASAAAREARAAGNEEAAKAAEQAAPEAPAKTADVVESHGVKTQIRTRKQVNVVNLREALDYILQSASDLELTGIVTLNPRALSSFLTRVHGGELRTEVKQPGLEVIEVEGIVNF